MSDLVWGVSTGSYSDYRVLCICPSKKEAEAVAAKVSAGEDSWHRDARAEAFATAAADVEKVGLLLMTTTLWDDGSETQQREEMRYEWPFDPLYGPEQMTWRWVRAPIHEGKGGRLDVRGRNHRLVRKTYSDKRAEFMADPVLRAKRSAQGRKP